MDGNQIAIEVTKIVISIFGFGATIYTLNFAYKQYKRSEEWKRGDFIAKEIKDFESNLSIRNSLLMIDWGMRPINLFLKQNPDENNYVIVTREDQWRALLPHQIKGDFPSISNNSTDINFSNKATVGNFSFIETRIRDSYDDFFVNLTRFSNFIEVGLIVPSEIKPYLEYWINSIAVAKNDYREDIPWKYVLIAYINFYDYSKVISIFERLGKNIKCDGSIFLSLERMLNEDNTNTVHLELVQHIRECLNLGSISSG